MNLREKLIETEKGFWLAGDDFARAHLTDQVMLVFRQMKGVYGRDQVAASMADTNRWHDLAMTDIMLSRPAEGLALLSYEARARRGDGTPYRALATSAYIRDGEEWLLASHQHSELEPPAEA